MNYQDLGYSLQADIDDIEKYMVGKAWTHDEFSDEHGNHCTVHYKEYSDALDAAKLYAAQLAGEVMAENSGTWSLDDAIQVLINFHYIEVGKYMGHNKPTDDYLCTEMTAVVHYKYGSGEVVVNKDFSAFERKGDGKALDAALDILEKFEVKNKE